MIRKTQNFSNISFTRADGSMASVSGYVILNDANSWHDVCISSADIIRLELTVAEVETASAAVSKVVVGIINLTQHPATLEQLTANVFEPDDKAAIQKLITFDELPSFIELERRATEVAEIADATGARLAMIGGAPFFMEPLAKALRRVGILPVYAFSKRVSVENTETGEKTSVFKHVGFVY